ncbi:shikimate kinase [Hyalangium sp.]|uniref:shikimate kinase n=1 Tax=Hyalangium sp. TaxID=2028555 RepID=UPI002D381ECD|nr:shikimate kinase [Hyalangium sp.]HYH94812.1 shikimate kinase [Hyalangium sp.]
MPERSADARRQILKQILDSVDHRLSSRLREALARPGPTARPAAGQTVVIAGHRAAGKTRLLPLVGRLLERPTLDLDAELERSSGRSLKTWVVEDPSAFRAAERQALLALPPGSLVAVGGGFLSHHPDALAGMFTLIIPVSFETYRDRLMTNTSRPRLRPGVPLLEEIASVFYEREALHARLPTVPLVDFLRAFWREVSP